MARPVLAAAVAAGLVGFGCGNVCTRIGGATEGLNGRGRGCDAAKVDPYDVAACERGLPSCTPDDLESLGQYAQCLENVPVCQPGGELSFSLSRLGCIQPLSRVRMACLGAMK